MATKKKGGLSGLKGTGSKLDKQIAEAKAKNAQKAEKEKLKKQNEAKRKELQKLRAKA